MASKRPLRSIPFCNGIVLTIIQLHSNFDLLLLPPPPPPPPQKKNTHTHTAEMYGKCCLILRERREGRQNLNAAYSLEAGIISLSLISLSVQIVSSCVFYFLVFSWHAVRKR